MTRKAWLITIGLIVIAGATMALLWLYWSPPITKQTSEQRGAADVTFKADTVLAGLENPWDTAFLPDGTLLFNERDGQLSKVVDGAKVVIQTIDDVQARGEGGLTGLALDHDFASNRYVYTCYNSTAGDVRVVRWRLNDGATNLDDKTPIVTGIPANPGGRHSGCRIKSADGGVLWIGTGDAAESSHPQNRNSLGGKILRVTRDGTPVAGNSSDGDKRIFSYGHRNVQGIALFEQPINGVYGYSIEHGPSENDEVNLLRAGNFGWDPRPPYNENVPMTDTTKFPGAIEAVWRSGSSTIAPSGGTIIRGEKWGTYNGAVAMAVLKNQQLRVLSFDASNNYKLGSEEVFFERQFGRLRSVSMGPDGNLYLTTDNSLDDKIIKVTPR